MNNLFISFDPNYRHLLFQNNTESFIRQSWKFLEASHFSKLSEEEAMMITGASDTEKAAAVLSKKIKGVFAITLGDKGALVRFEDNIEILPGIQAKVIDTTGAGDAFAGAILYQLQKRLEEGLNTLAFNDWKTIIANANKTGALVCEHMGAMEAFKHLNNTFFK